MNRRPNRLPGSNRRLLLPLAAGALVTLGTLLLVSPGADSAEADPAADLVATVVAERPIAAGTPVIEALGSVTVRMLPADARADGAIGEIDGAAGLATYADAIITSDLVAGEQVLSGDIATDPVAAIAPDFVAVSVRLDPQRWTGPFATTGAEVDVYATGDAIPATRIVDGARIVAAPDTTDLDPRSEAVITLAVPAADVAAVIDAAASSTIWLVGS
ncbi:MAG: hypothetical protein RIR49_899 [Actinomycetota bacterium]|jgi:hypothetical protein